ncbi:MAG: Rpn family recombination-promoting nuclease/putative transposase, partial [Bacteroidales bacterium]|nr:Rpn family recombination-promoting nuclease/putative transposase [Bacteroidales bacterium]
MQKNVIKPTAGSNNSSSANNNRQSQGIFQNLTSDFSFKRVFQQKKYLISFINALLNDFKEKVVDVEYLPTEHLGQTEQDRNAVFDLLCRNEKG